MGQVLHGSATTTEAIRRAIQHSQASLRALRSATGSTGRRSPSGGSGPRSPTSARGRRIRVRRCCHVRTKRSSSPFVVIRSCHSMTASPRSGDDPAPDPLVTAHVPAGLRHQPIAGGRRRQAQAVPLQGLSAGLFPHRSGGGSIRRKGGSTCSSPSTADQFAFVELHERPAAGCGRLPPRHLIEAVPYKVHTVLTDNGPTFTTSRNVASVASIIKRRLQPARPSEPTASSPPVPATISIIV